MVVRGRFLSALAGSLVFAALAVTAPCFAWETDTARIGSTFETIPLGEEPAVAGPNSCAELCENEDRCLSWTYVRPGNPDQGATDFGLCLLKDSVPDPVSAECCVSGTKQTGEPSSEDAKPSGEGLPWIGIRIQNVTKEIAALAGTTLESGVYVAQVAKDGPADSAGIRPGDIINGLDGKAIADMRELARAVASGNPGDRVEVDLIRNSEPLRLTLEIGSAPAKGGK